MLPPKIKTPLHKFVQMGCCFSTPKQDQNGLKNQHHPQLRSHAPKSNATHEANCRVPLPLPPPLPVVEEEFVKEVLSETPISKPQIPILKPETNTQMPIMQSRKCPITEEPSEEVSLISETCSVGESLSTTTATATVPETREDEVTSKRISTGEGIRNRNRTHYDASRKGSYTVEGNRTGGRERRPKSPARVPDNPPEKKVLVSSRSVRRRELSDRIRRDSGQGSGRRSRSPSCARTVGGGAARCQLRPPGGSGRRLPAAAKGKSEEVVGETNDGVSMEESLENPHVSLECFIFL